MKAGPTPGRRSGLVLVEVVQYPLLAVFVIVSGVHYVSARNDAEQRNREDVGAFVEATGFDRSCSPDGTLVSSDERNCLERGGFRLGRAGLATFAAEIGQDGKPTVVYRFGSDRDIAGSFDDWRRMDRAFRDGTDPTGVEDKTEASR